MSATVAPPHSPPAEAPPPPVAPEPLAVEEHAPEPLAVAPPTPGNARRARLESLAILLVFGVAYALLGYQVIAVQHVVVFDALDRLAQASMVWHDAPPKLAAIGFTSPPLTTLIYAPLAAIKPLASSLVALPVTSAVLAAGTIVMLNRILARCEMPALLRWPLLLVFGANPEFAYYASNGMSDMAYLFLLACGLYAFVSWMITGAGRYLIFAGLALSICALTRYEFILWGALMALMVAAALIRWRASRSEVEASTIAFAAPMVYAIALWTLFNALIAGDALDWISTKSSTLAVNADQTLHGAGASFGQVVQRLNEIVSGTSPIAYAVIPLLLLLFFARRDDVALWLTGFVALGIVAVGADALISDREGVLMLRDGLTIGLAAMVGAAWVFRSSDGARLAVWLGILALLAAALPLAWQQMKTYPYQSQDQAFTRAIETGRDQEGTTSIGGFRVGVGPELQMARYVKRHAGTRHHQILTDNAKTFAVTLLSGRQAIFVDRVQRGDAAWRAVRDHPYGHVRYMLASLGAQGDLIRSRYPAAVAGNAPASFPVAFRTSRYVLLRVPPRPPAKPTTPTPSAPTP